MINLEEKVMQIIGGTNRSDYSVKDFITSLTRVQQNEDYEIDWHVTDTFLHDNDFDWEFRRDLEKVCKVFLGLELVYEDDDQEEEGPYGGAFRSWDDFWGWKEG